MANLDGEKLYQVAQNAAAAIDAQLELLGVKRKPYKTIELSTEHSSHYSYNDTLEGVLVDLIYLFCLEDQPKEEDRTCRHCTWEHICTKHLQGYNKRCGRFKYDPPDGGYYG